MSFRCFSLKYRSVLTDNLSSNFQWSLEKVRYQGCTCWMRECGTNVVVDGSVANFAAYTFAPPILVTPLGALSVLIGYAPTLSYPFVLVATSLTCSAMTQSRSRVLLPERATGPNRNSRMFIMSCREYHHCATCP